MGNDTYSAKPQRYDRMQYRTCGRSGLKLPAISLGLWHNFGDTALLANQRAMLRTAFDLGIRDLCTTRVFWPSRRMNATL